MATEPDPRFRVVWPTSQQRRAFRLRAKARRVGAGRELLADLKILQQCLSTEPLSWGDPLYHYHHLGLVVYHALLTLIQVYYAVDQARRIVYIKEVSPLPGRALGRG